MTVALYDALGRRVAVLHDGAMQAQQTARLRVPVQRLASGVYFVRVTGEGVRATTRLTVVR